LRMVLGLVDESFFGACPGREKEFFIDNLLVRIHFTTVMIMWTGLAPWEFEFKHLVLLGTTREEQLKTF